MKNYCLQCSEYNQHVYINALPSVQYNMLSWMKLDMRGVFDANKFEGVLGLKALASQGF